MAYKFEQLEVWKLSLGDINLIYVLAEKLPKNEEYNLKSQIIRAATSVSLNIAEGSTGQTNAEQARFLGIAIRSLIETVACQHIIKQRGYIQDENLLKKLYEESEILAKKLQNFENLYLPHNIKFEKILLYMEMMICHSRFLSSTLAPDASAGVVNGQSSFTKTHG